MVKASLLILMVKNMKENIKMEKDQGRGKFFLKMGINMKVSFGMVKKWKRKI